MNRPFYTPIDALLDLPRVRLLRALRRFDRATVGDLLLALDVGDRLERERCRTQLARLVARGHVESDASRCPPIYRITAAGVRHLERTLARAELRASS